VVIATIADQIVRGVDAVTDTLAAPFGDPVIRLGVTGLSRAGKTVFITALVANLMNRGRMPQLIAAQSGAIRTAYLQPQPDDTLPRFDFENYLLLRTKIKNRWFTPIILLPKTNTMSAIHLPITSRRFILHVNLSIYIQERW